MSKEKERPRRKPGPKAPPKRIPNTYRIRVKMLEPIKSGKREITNLEITDKVNKLLRRHLTPAYISYIINGDRHALEIQRAVARVLGIPFDEAFLKQTADAKRGKKE